MSGNVSEDEENTSSESSEDETESDDEEESTSEEDSEESNASEEPEEPEKEEQTEVIEFPILQNLYLFEIRFPHRPVSILFVRNPIEYFAFDYNERRRVRMHLISAGTSTWKCVFQVYSQFGNASDEHVPKTFLH